MRVLVVDDNSVANSTLCEVLKQEDFDVHSAGNGHGALTVLGMGPKPDAMIVDLLMPGMDGLELVQWLRARSEYDAVPILMMSAAPDFFLTTLVGLTGVETVRKPIEPSFVVNWLHSLKKRGLTAVKAQTPTEESGS